MSQPTWKIAKPGCEGEGKPRTILGEGPVWSVQDQCLYWVDIERKLLHRFQPTQSDDASSSSSASSPVSGHHSTVDFGQMAGCLALTERPQQVLLAAANGIHLFDWSSLKSYQLSPFPNHRQGSPEEYRFNDGGVTPAGTWMVGSLFLDEEHGSGKGRLFEYAISSEGVLKSRVVLEGVSIPNGIEWDREGTKVFFVDTPEQKVEVFEYNKEESEAFVKAAKEEEAAALPSPLTARRTVFSIPSEYGHPDGNTMDADGNLYTAMWDGGRVLQWTPEGKLLRTIPLPTPRTTAPCFGGPELKDLYVTSASRDMDPVKEPLAGSLFVVHNAGQGRPVLVVKGQIKGEESKAVQHQLVQQ